MLLHIESLSVVPLPASKTENPQTSHLTFLFYPGVSNYLLEKITCSESCLNFFFFSCLAHTECSKWDLPMNKLSWGVDSCPQWPFSPLPNFIPFCWRAAVTTGAGTDLILALGNVAAVHPIRQSLGTCKIQPSFCHLLSHQNWVHRGKVRSLQWGPGGGTGDA